MENSKGIKFVDSLELGGDVKVGYDIKYQMLYVYLGLEGSGNFTKEKTEEIITTIAKLRGRIRPIMLTRTVEWVSEILYEIYGLETSLKAQWLEKMGEGEEFPGYAIEAGPNDTLKTLIDRIFETTETVEDSEVQGLINELNTEFGLSLQTR